MSWYEHTTRALHLLGFAIAPRVLSPEPPSARSLAVGILSVFVLACLSVLAARLLGATRLTGRLASVACALAVVAALAFGAAFSGSRAPLARGAWYVAPLVWIALALVAASISERRFAARHPRAAIL